MRQVEAGRRSRKSARSPEESNLEAGTKSSKSPRSPEESKAQQAWKQVRRSRKNPRSPEESNFKSRLGIVEQHYLEAIPGLFVLAKTVSHHPPPGYASVRIGRGWSCHFFKLERQFQE